MIGAEQKSAAGTVKRRIGAKSNLTIICTAPTSDRDP